MTFQRRSWTSGAGELTLVALVYLTYRVGRTLTADAAAVARQHGHLVERLERVLHLPSEAAIQAAVGSPDLFKAANLYYVTAHFPIAIAFLVWGFLARPPVEYRWARNLMVSQTLVAVAVHIAFPLAPPRMFPAAGFRDTAALYGPSAYDSASGALANQYAAMPSLHVGWAVLIAVVVWRTGPRLVRYLAALHALLTFAVVTITANHWFLDALVAVAILGLALLVLPAPGRVRNPLRGLRAGPTRAPRPLPGSRAIPVALRSVAAPVSAPRPAIVATATDRPDRAAS